jgi:excinuclease ABC subunit C
MPAADVLYVGKAKNVRKRLSSYARVAAPQPARILRMIAATVSVEIVSTSTETEALLLEANLIKQLRPRFNVQLRDDKSFPYILITGDHWAPQILKHRGAQSRPGRYFGPFASAGAVNRTITALQRAFLIRSCTDGFFRKPHPALPALPDPPLFGPCTGEIDFPGYTELVREATDFLSRPQPSGEAGASRAKWKRPRRTRFETAALYRDRLAALSGDPVAAGHQSAHRAGRPMCSPSIRRAAIPASRCSSSAPDKTGATAPIFRARKNPSRRRRCWPRSWRNSTTTSRRRN